MDVKDLPILIEVINDATKKFGEVLSKYNGKLDSLDEKERELVTSIAVDMFFIGVNFGLNGKEKNK